MHKVYYVIYLYCFINTGCGDLGKHEGYRECLRSAGEEQAKCMEQCRVDIYISCAEVCIDGYKRKIETCPCITGLCLLTILKYISAI